MNTLSERLAELSGKATPGDWKTEYDPTDGKDHATAICLPGRSGLHGTFLAYFQHNWNDADYAERRISWKEAETNAALIVELVNAFRAGRLIVKDEAHD